MNEMAVMFLDGQCDSKWINIEPDKYCVGANWWSFLKPSVALPTYDGSKQGQ